MSNTPSEELRLLLQEARSALWQPANAELCERIDDALARWGTPQPVVREPFCYVSVDKHGDITRMLKWKDKWTNIPLYTAPQPAQVQPVVREPLTDEQRHALSIAFSSSKVSISEVQRRMKISYSRAQEICQWIVDSGFAQGLPTAPSLKADLGITGGQHGD